MLDELKKRTKSLESRSFRLIKSEHTKLREELVTQHEFNAKVEAIIKTTEMAISVITETLANKTK